MIYVNGIIVSPNARNLAVGYQCTLSTRIAPKAATNQTIIWRSEDSTVASVDPTTGVITGKKPGTVKIYACATDGSGVEGKATITVEYPIRVTSVDVQPNTVIEAKPGEKIYHIYANVLPLNATMPDLIWSSSNEEIATVQSNGIVTIHKDGVVQITATSVEGGLSDSCTINVDSREKVTIEKDGDFNKVVFENGKVWHCINNDMIFNEENAFNEVLSERNGINCFVDPYDHNTEKKTYTDNELLFLYTIDPLGVAKYVDTYTRMMELNEKLSYKDRIFNLLFNREPKYFARTVSGQWYTTEDKSNLKAVLSESEIIFGTHLIFDFTTIIQMVGLVIDLFSLMLGQKARNIYDVVKSILLIVSKGEQGAKETIFSFGVGEIFDVTNLNWLEVFVTMHQGIEDIVGAIKSKPALYPHFIDYYVSNEEYRMFLKLSNNEVLEMKNIQQALNC